jgi:hypothetical protein
MASKARSQNAFLYPERLRESSIQEERTSKSRQATVYDAVAGTYISANLDLFPFMQALTVQVGRISAAGFIPKQLVISSTRDTASSSTSAVPPEAVLFRRKSAPTRYEELDIYFANERDLRTELPESELLKALHCYTSDFYSHATADAGTGDYRSLDETALIALGILMEETARDTLGQTGDLVFTEGQEVQGSSSKNAGAVSTASDSSRVRPLKKRRRIGTAGSASGNNEI